MTERTHITAGRTAIKALLVAAVLTAGIAGTVGTVAAEPMDGKGNDVYPPPTLYSLDGKGNDVVTDAFSFDDVTLLTGSQFLSIGFFSSSGSMEEEEPLQM